MIIFNEGQEGRTGLPAGTLGEPIDIPVVGMTFADGSALYQQLQGGATVTLHITTSTEADLDATTKNLIADTKTGNADETVVVGAHLDSVVEGPGINDNGSGTAAILEIAEGMAEQKVKPRRAVRFAFWGAEESGLLGSEHYVTTLPANELTQIYANLNFDMVGSPNYARFVYDGDGSDTPDAGPPGSDVIESVFTRYFASQGLASEPTAFDGRSDYGPFIAAGIPAGGLFTGAEGIKTAEQAAKYGGTAGVAVRPLLPPGLRHDHQPERERAERDERRGRARDPDARQVQVRPVPGRLPQGRPGQVQGQEVRQRGRSLVP